MKKVLTAVNHPAINEYFKTNCPELLIEHGDIESQQELLNLLMNDIPDVLVLNDELPGKYDKNTLIEKIRNINKYFKIVIIVSVLNQDIKNFLYAKGIFDIMVNDQTHISDLVEAVSRESRVVVKVEKEVPKEVREELQTLKKLLEEKPKVIEKHIIFETAPKTQRQEIITVAGTGGSGKSDFITQIAVLLAKKSQANILCIDLNTEFPTLDQFLGVPRQPEHVDYFIGNDKNSSINYIVDSIDKGRLDSKTFEELVVSHKKFDNLHIITGNYSLYACKNTLNNLYYKTILEKAKALYDFIFIDTSSNVFLDSTQYAITNANRIFFVLNPTHAELRKSKTLLELFTKNWDVNKDKINLIANKVNQYSVDNEAVKEIFTDFKLCKSINYNPKHEYCLNNGIPFVMKCKEKELKPYLKILESFNFVEKSNFFNKLFSKKTKKVDEQIRTVSNAD